MLGARVLVTGTLTRLDRVIRANLQAVDVETAMLLAAATAELPRTPGYDRLFDSPLYEPPATDAAAKRSVAAPRQRQPARPSRQAGSFTFDLTSCGFEGIQLHCRLQVSNDAPGVRTLTLAGSSSVYDSDGVDYRLQSATIGSTRSDLPRSSSTASRDLSPELGVELDLVFSQVSRRKKKLQRLEVVLDGGERVSFDDVFLTRD